MRPFKSRSEEGATMVETAIAATLMLGVVFSLFEIFMAFYTYHYVSFAAREATRYAIVRGSECSTDSLTMPGCGANQSDILSFVQGLNFPGINPSNVSVTATWFTANVASSGKSVSSWTNCSANTGLSAGCNIPGNEVQVQVTYSFTKFPSISFDPFGITNQSLTLTSTSQMVISQ